MTRSLRLKHGHGGDETCPAAGGRARPRAEARAVLPVRADRRHDPHRRGDLLLRRRLYFGVTGDRDHAPDVDVLTAGIGRGSRAARARGCYLTFPAPAPRPARSRRTRRARRSARRARAAGASVSTYRVPDEPNGWRSPPRRRWGFSLFVRDLEPVELVRQLAQHAERLGGERLVDLPHVDVLRGQAGAPNRLGDGHAGAMPMMRVERVRRRPPTRASGAMPSSSAAPRRRARPSWRRRSAGRSCPPSSAWCPAGRAAWRDPRPSCSARIPSSYSGRLAKRSIRVEIPGTAQAARWTFEHDEGSARPRRPRVSPSVPAQPGHHADDGGQLRPAERRRQLVVLAGAAAGRGARHRAARAVVASATHALDPQIMASRPRGPSQGDSARPA